MGWRFLFSWWFNKVTAASMGVVGKTALSITPDETANSLQGKDRFVSTCSGHFLTRLYRYIRLEHNCITIQFNLALPSLPCLRPFLLTVPCLTYVDALTLCQCLTLMPWYNFMTLRPFSGERTQEASSLASRCSRVRHMKSSCSFFRQSSFFRVLFGIWKYIIGVNGREPFRVFFPLCNLWFFFLLLLVDVCVCGCARR